MNVVKIFFWDDPYLYLSCADGIIHRCVPELEILSGPKACHSLPISGYHSGVKTAHKILQCGHYWPTIHQYYHEFAKSCDSFQREWDFKEARVSYESNHGN